LVDILRVAHTNPITNVSRHSLNKSVDELAQPNGKRNLSDKKEHKIISKLKSATHVLPVLTFPLSLGFAAGNLE